MNIHEMKLAAAGKLKKMRDIVNLAEGESRDLTKEEQAAYNALRDDRAAMQARIDRAEELEQEEAALSQLDDKPHRPKPTENAGASKDPINSPEYVEAFAVVMSARRAAVPADANAALQIGSNDGHYAVPEEYRSEMIKKLGAHNCARQICNVIPTTSTENIPVVTDNGTAGWVDELGTYPESDIDGENKVLGAHKLGRISKISEELLADEAVSLTTVLSDAYAKSFGEAEEQGFFNGDGNKKPTGITSQITQSLEAAAVAGISYDDLVDLQHKVKRAYRANGVFVANDLTIAALRKLKNDKGEPLWQDSMREGEPDRLFGKPVFTSDAIAVPGANAASVLFGDFKQGVDIGDRGTIEMQRLEELYAAQGAVGFRMRSRVDCVVKDTAALAKLVHPAS